MADTDTAQAPTDAASPTILTTPPASAAAASVPATPAADSSAVQAAALAAEKPDATASVVPEQYDLKLPKDAKADAAFVERTAAKARVLGLGNDAAQKLLESDLADHTGRLAERDALVESWKPGGAEFEKRNADWVKQAKADPELGVTPEAFASTIEKAQQALAKYGPELKDVLEVSGFGSHPAAIKFFARVGAAMSEGGLVLGVSGKSPAPKSTADLLYGQPTG